MSKFSRQRIILVEIDQPFCTRTYGVGPCTAVLGTTGQRKCFNTEATCQDPANYDGATEPPITLSFTQPQDGLTEYGYLIPSLQSMSVTPAEVNLSAMERNSGALGQREVVTLRFTDHQHSDHKLDKYRLERESGAAQFSAVGYRPIDFGTFWGKWLARNPYHTAYQIRIREGFVGDDVNDMRVRNYVIDRVEGPTNGSVTMVAKDLFSKIEKLKAVAPKASNGRMVAGVTAAASQVFTLAPAGIGNLEYPASGFVVIGEEEAAFTRSGDSVTLTTRGTGGTTAAAHSAEDKVQLVLVYTAQLAQDIVYDLLLNYTELVSAQLPIADWDIAMAAITEQYTTHITEPTAVLDLIGELSEQAGFTIFPNLATGVIKMVPLRAAAPAYTIIDSKDMLEDSISVKRQDSRRVTQVHVYYGQRNVTGDLDDTKNYSSRAITVDPSAETQYGTPVIKQIFSRWLPQFSRAFALRIGERVLQLFRDPPLESKFKVHADVWSSRLELAQFITPLIDEIQDDIGEKRTTIQAVLSLEHEDDQLEVTSQQVTLTPEDPTAERVIFVDSDTANLNMRAVHDLLYSAPTGVETVRFVVGDGVEVNSTSNTMFSIDTGDWPAGVSLTLEVIGNVRAAGGKAGKGGVSGPGAAGSPGGVALKVRRALDLDGDGFIYAGGGGGGGGGGLWNRSLIPNRYIGGAGGGGGAGDVPGAAGAGGSSWNGASGTAGTAGTAADGGNPGSPGNEPGSFGGIGGTAGAGGDPGVAGGNGGTSSSTGNPAFYTAYGGGAGGAAGKSIEGIAFVTQIGTVTLVGPTS